MSFLRILDEEHKAYSENAQRTLRNLNPCTIVELSDTPPKEANKLVVISVPAMRDKEITYEIVFQDEWEKRLNELLA